MSRRCVVKKRRVLRPILYGVTLEPVPGSEQLPGAYVGNCVGWYDLKDVSSYFHEVCRYQPNFFIQSKENLLRNFRLVNRDGDQYGYSWLLYGHSWAYMASTLELDPVELDSDHLMIPASWAEVIFRLADEGVLSVSEERYPLQERPHHGSKYLCGHIGDGRVLINMSNYPYSINPLPRELAAV